MPPTKHPKVKAWLAANPRIHIHFTPSSRSWLNLVEIWFGIIERQAIHRGTFASVRELMIKIRAFINGWNDRCQPSLYYGLTPWTKAHVTMLPKWTFEPSFGDCLTTWFGFEDGSAPVNLATSPCCSIWLFAAPESNSTTSGTVVMSGGSSTGPITLGALMRGAPAIAVRSA
jgi:DDE superfamily endonuclease